ncbi:MAG: hypothetical protein ACYDC6_14845 [Acidobacteriaceae bacterium]
MPSSQIITGTKPVILSVTIATAGAFKADLLLDEHKFPWFPAGGVAALACALPFLIPKRRRNWRTLLGLFFALTVIGTVGCGSMGPRTTPGSYTYTATVGDADTGKIKASCNFTVIVQ